MAKAEMRMLLSANIVEVDPFSGNGGGGKCSMRGDVWQVCLIYGIQRLALLRSCESARHPISRNRQHRVTLSQAYPGKFTPQGAASLRDIVH